MTFFPEISSSILVLAQWTLIGYLLGSIPFGVVISNLMGLGDLRKIGSGNIGATNVLRTGNKFAAAATLILDGGKGAVAVFIASSIAPSDAVKMAALAAFLGHCFPIWLRFKGGKGVATAIATICAIDFLTGLMMIACWLVVAALFRISSLAALISFFCAVIFGYFYASLTDIQMGVILCISALSIARHHENIRRLMAGEEARISFGKKGS